MERIGVLCAQLMKRLELKIGLLIVVLLVVGFFRQSAVPQRLPVVVSEPERVSVSRSFKTASAPSVGVTSAAVAASTQIARVGQVSLLVPNLDKALQAVYALIHRQRGDLVSLDDRNPEETRLHRTSQMEIRVPENRFDTTMSALSQIGKARARSISAEDLSSQIVDSAARLRNLRRTENDISRIMDRAGSIGQVLDAENQLSFVREHIETLEAELETMQTRVRYSTIKVTMEAEAASQVVATSGATQLADAWHSALHALWQLTLGLAVALMWIAVFVPYVIVATLLLSVLNLRFRKTRRSV